MQSFSSLPHRKFCGLLFKKIMKASDVTWCVSLICLLVFVFSDLVKGQNQSDVVAARVNGVAISQPEVDKAVVKQTYQLERQLYSIRKVALENVIIQKLLEQEASRRGTTVDRLKQELMAGPVAVSKDDVEKTYQQNAAAFGLLSPDEAKEKIRLDLEAQVRLRRYREALQQLRRSANIEIFLEEPRLVRSETTEARLPSLGPANAPVAITEFSDFQCPYCKQAQPVIKKILEEYASQVRLEFRQLPIPVHPFARLSAQASLCANEQGSFWQFHDALFDAKEITAETIDQISERLHLDSAKIRQCLNSPQTLATIEADLNEAQRLGINGTPTFIINGKLFGGMIPLEELRLIIDREIQLSKTDPHQQKPATLSQKEPRK